MTKYFKKPLIILLLLVILLPLVGYGVLRFGLSKDNFSYPAQDHSHLRLKYIYQGQEEDFGSPRYQTDYTKDVCNGSLTTSPLHFHDQKTDYQHLHWARSTGGQFLKFYGLNFIGGMDQYMGFKLDELPKITPIPIHSNSLPKPRDGDKFFVYSGTETLEGWKYQKRNFDDFIKQDFETFFGKESQVRKDFEENKKNQSSILRILNSIQISAHEGKDHKTLDEETKHNMEVAEKLRANILNNQTAIGANPSNSNQVATSSTTNSSQNATQPKTYDPISGEELKSINNFIGDVVIFVQKEEPTNEQILSRFQSMIKLDKSSCGG
jgi:hypothetical protein